MTRDTPWIQTEKAFVPSVGCAPCGTRNRNPPPLQPPAVSPSTAETPKVELVLVSCVQVT